MNKNNNLQSFSTSGVTALIARAEALIARFEALLPDVAAPVDWDASIAFRWRKHQGQQGRGVLQPVRQVHRIELKDLRGIDEQKSLVDQNTRQFVEGHPANNVLLTGARGTGKSSLIKALLNKDRKSTRLNSSHVSESRMPSSA